MRASDPGTVQTPVAKLQRASERSRGRGRQDKRALILEAAIRVFARMGYHEARVADIAREAGIAYGLVYHYFRNKEEVLATIFEERWSAFLGSVEAIAASSVPVRDKLVAIAALVLGAYRVRPDWVKLLVFEIQRSPRFADPERVRAVGRLFQAVAEMLADGQASGELRPDVDPKIASSVFLGALEIAITTLVLEVTRIDASESQDDYYRRVAGTIVDVFVNGVAGGVA